MNENLEKRMRAALEQAADAIDAATDLLEDEDEDDVDGARDLANECRALAKEGVK